jgi:hypothetical protein
MPSIHAWLFGDGDQMPSGACACRLRSYGALKTILVGLKGAFKQAVSRDWSCAALVLNKKLLLMSRQERLFRRMLV